jgi:hypothetical protein
MRNPTQGQEGLLAGEAKQQQKHKNALEKPKRTTHHQN